VTQDDSLLGLLACPKCRGALRRVASPSAPSASSAASALGCERCRLLYAIDDGLPNMLVEDAKPWTLPEAQSGAGGAEA
jgi:uncharacterized protein YbaR (Trm112 family)